MPEQELELNEPAEGGKKSNKLVIFGGIGLVLVLLIGGGLWFFMGSDEPAPIAVNADESTEAVAPVNNAEADSVLTQKHIPLIEDALLTTFSAADVQKLSTQAGKDELRQLALLNVQNTLQPITGKKVVEKVLFTGFVMQ